MARSRLSANPVRHASSVVVKELKYQIEQLERRVLLDATADAVKRLELSPAVFVENQGQWDESVRFVHQGKGATIALTNAGPVFDLYRSTPRISTDSLSVLDQMNGLDARQRGTIQSTRFSVTFDGANVTRPVGSDRSSSYFNYFIGDRSTWRSNVGGFETVSYPNLYSGIDLLTWGKRDHLKYEFHVAPGADYSQIQISYEGINGLSIDSMGRLHISTKLDELIDDAPYVYQQIEGKPIEVTSHFVLMDNNTYGFEIAGRFNPNYPLIIDPSLAWATYLGGSSDDYGNGITTNSAGNCLVTGYVASTNLAGATNSYRGGTFDAFVAKVSASGILTWATYVGGTSSDYGYGIVTDSAGNAWVTGLTSSSGWANGGFDTSYNGGTDAFVAKINTDGTLAWSGYLGGSSQDRGYSIAIDSSGNAYVSGDTTSSGWTVGGFDTSYNGLSDTFIAKINADGTFGWSSYLGGTSNEWTGRTAVDSSGNVWVGAQTFSSGWTSGGLDTSYNGAGDGYIAKINANGTFGWSSYLGGTAADEIDGIATDGSGNAWVTGITGSSGWTIAGFDTSYNGGSLDAFVAKINGNGTLAWSSYLGGSAEDRGHSIATDGLGNAWVTGYTTSSGWTVRGFNTSYNGGGDAYVGKINADGTLAWTSYLGGSSEDRGYGIATDSANNALATGTTTSTNFAGANNSYKGGGVDGFVAKFTDIPVDAAGNTLGTARDLGSLGDSQSFSDWIGNSDTNDYYKFGLTSIAVDWSFIVMLSGLTADADLQLLNSTGSVLWTGSASGTGTEGLSRVLKAGTYYVRVFPGIGGAQTGYGLTVGASPISPVDNAGNTLVAARAVGTLNSPKQFSDWIGDADSNDYYSFSLASGGNWNYTLSLSNLASNIDVQLLNSSGASLWTGATTGTASESDARELAPGNYYLRVYPAAAGNNSSYSLTLNATAVPGAGAQTIFEWTNFDSGSGADIKGVITALAGVAWNTITGYLDEGLDFIGATAAGFKFGVKASLPAGQGAIIEPLSVGVGMSIERRPAQHTWTISRGFEAKFGPTVDLKLVGNDFITIPDDTGITGQPITAGFELIGDFNITGAPDEVLAGVNEVAYVAAGLGLRVGPRLAMRVETDMTRQEFLALTGQSTTLSALLDSFGFIASSWMEATTDLLGKLSPVGRPLLSLLGQGDDPLGLLIRHNGDLRLSLQEAVGSQASPLIVNAGVGLSVGIGVAAALYGKVYVNHTWDTNTLWSKTISRAQLAVPDDVGNSRVSASAMLPRQMRTQILSTNDRDYFAFESDQGEAHQFAFVNAGINGATIVVQDVSGNVLRRVNATTTGTTVVSAMIQQRGQYFVSIEGTPTSTSGSYSLTWTPDIPDGTFTSGTSGFQTSGQVNLVTRGSDDYAMQLQEHSPASATMTVDVVATKPMLSFAYRMTAAGDGDQLQVKANGTTVWSAAISVTQTDFVVSPQIDLTAYAGQTINLEFALASVGAANARLEIDDIVLQPVVLGPLIGVSDDRGDSADRIVAAAPARTGNSSLSHVSLLNSGDQSLNITGLTKGGTNAGDFTVVVRDDSGSVVSGNFSIPAGKTYMIDVTFAPSALGSRSASLSFTTNSAATADQSVSIALSGVGDNTSPVAGATSFQVDSQFQKLNFAFDENVGTSLSVSDLLLQNLTTSGTVTASSVVFDLATNTASFNINSVLPDGNYHAVLSGAGVTDTAGNPLGTDVTSDFFFLQADANRDRKVNTLDFNLLAGNFGGSGKVFSQGDFNYTGAVDSVDFGILVSQYGKTLPSAAPVTATSLSIVGQAPALFGSMIVQDETTVVDII